MYDWKSSNFPRSASFAALRVSAVSVPAYRASSVLVAPNAPLVYAMVSFDRYVSSVPAPVSTARGARFEYGVLLICWAAPQFRAPVSRTARHSVQPPLRVELQKSSMLLAARIGDGSRSWLPGAAFGSRRTTDQSAVV